ncbi:heme uptake protein IsdC [Paenibacillus sp. LHD-117]|uniref:heme uptake protein IsdC n=1 Tax=Paenibacillus sp. LHD-117 TaxID=3071412 RepID=UPI0027E10D39|nr:heme uptake protein IsdC [Paenibacillus sp. LHD-117]MDQ6422040.1 heme uptake protein IsdC [Paenibacillus sp. LHD-117]
MNMRIGGLIAALWIWMIAWPGSAEAAGELADGTYTADYLILKAENDSVSMANDYWEKPATVTVKGGKATVRVTINHSYWVTQFKVPGGGGYVDTKVISSNKKADTRLVEFAADITKPIESKIHVTVEEIDYDHDYTIRFVFDPDSFKLVKGAAATTKPTAAPTQKPTNESASAENPSAKPAETTKPSADAAVTERPAASVEAGSESSGGGAATSKPAANGEAAPQPSAASAEPSASATVGQAEEEANGDSESKTGEHSDAGAVESGFGDGSGGAQLAGASGQAGEAAASEGEAAPALAAGDTAEMPADSGKGSGFVWWTPLAALLILAIGGVYIWRRRAG